MKKFLLFLFFIAGVLQAQTPDSTIIRGRAFMANGITPFSRCRITILRVWAQGTITSADPQVVQADTMGRFAISVPKSDSTVVTLRAPLVGYSSTAGTTFRVPANVDSCQLSNVVLVATPFATGAILADVDTVKRWMRGYVQDSVWNRIVVEYIPPFPDPNCAFSYGDGSIKFVLRSGDKTSDATRHPLYLAALQIIKNDMETGCGLGLAMWVEVELSKYVEFDSLFRNYDGVTANPNVKYTVMPGAGTVSESDVGIMQHSAGLHIDIGGETMEGVGYSSVITAKQGVVFPKQSESFWGAEFHGTFTVVSSGHLFLTDFSNSNFTDADVLSYELYNTWLDGANFNGLTINSNYMVSGYLANFHGIWGRGSKWESTILNSCSFDYSHMDSCIMRCSQQNNTQARSVDWRGSDLSYMKVTNGWFWSSTDNGAQSHDGASRFDGVLTKMSVFENCNFEGSAYYDKGGVGHMRDRTVWYNSNDSGAKFIDCILTHNRLDSLANGTYMVFRDCDLDSSTATYTHFDYSKFTGSNLTNVDFANSYFVGTSFRGATLTGANLAGAFAGDSNFIRCDFTGANLAGTFVFNAGLMNTGAFDCTFTGANLDSLDLWGASFDGSSFRFATFVGAVLSGASFKNCNLTGAVLGMDKATFKSTVLDWSGVIWVDGLPI